MKLCVFQGTFNPIHKAHIDMAEFVLKNFGFEKIIFIPAANPPHKDYDKRMSIHRLKMVELAIKKFKGFEVSNIEFLLEGKSYSYLTALELYKQYDVSGKINFIIGTDAFEKLDSWYESKKLRKLVNFIVFVRENDFYSQKYDKMKEKGYNFKFAQMGYNDISSSSIREKISENKSLDGLTPKIVERYIQENGLYKN